MTSSLLAQALEPSNGNQTEQSLAAALTTISEVALHGPSMGRTQAVVRHLSTVAANHAVTSELRTMCDELIDVWEDIA